MKKFRIIFLVSLFFLFPLSIFAGGLMEMPINSYMDVLTSSFDKQLADLLPGTSDLDTATLYKDTFSTYKDGIHYYAVTYYAQYFKYSPEPSTMMTEIQQLRDLKASVSLPGSFTKDMENLKSWGFKLPTPQEVRMAFYH
jgi:hypothetical protein